MLSRIGDVTICCGLELQEYIGKHIAIILACLPELHPLGSGKIKGLLDFVDFLSLGLLCLEGLTFASDSGSRHRG